MTNPTGCVTNPSSAGPVNPQMWQFNVEMMNASFVKRDNLGLNSGPINACWTADGDMTGSKEAELTCVNPLRFCREFVIVRCADKGVGLIHKTKDYPPTLTYVFHFDDVNH